MPLKRPPITFDPQTGKLAFPWLRPHLGKRPLFAPNHGGVPRLEPLHVREDGTKSTEPAKPGEQGPWSVCTSDSPRKFYTNHAITLPITLKKATPKAPAIVDPIGMIFVLHEEEDHANRIYDRRGLGRCLLQGNRQRDGDRKSTRLNSSHLVISYAVFCLKKKSDI